ncbi:MAG: glucose-6-phosphate dehydrogenase, partial [Candidatus Promineifilaceae bacterium]
MNESTTIVIFGASGDLTQRKLVPALWTLYRKQRLAGTFQIIGFSRRKMSSADFRAKMAKGVKTFSREPFDETEWDTFSQRLFYCPGSTTEPSGYIKLKATLENIEAGPANRLYYLSVPPKIFTPIVRNLYDLGMTIEADGWRRVIVEKPFGNNLASAQALNTALHEVLAEKQIYRIDHYLAKETVQNIMVFRFGNTIFEPIWNRNYIESVQITAAESVDVGHRAGYYDGSGVLRDMFQNHLLQLLALVAMEPPASFQADAIRNEKVKVLSAVRPITKTNIAQNTVRAQYNDYLEAEGVAENSQTPTFAALRLFVDSWRWQGVPFYLRSGKALKDKTTEITIKFKRPPLSLFPLPDDYEFDSNMLSICVQPDEGMHLQI